MSPPRTAPLSHRSAHCAGRDCISLPPSGVLISVAGWRISSPMGGQWRWVAVAAFAAVFACGSEGGAVDGDASATDAAPIGPRPGKRSDVAGAGDPTTGAIALFGGDDGAIVDQIPVAHYLEDTWLFEPDSGWSEIASPGPSARGRHAVGFDPAGTRMMVFGGRYRAGSSGNYTLYDDLWAFDLTARTWTQLSTGGGPAPRYFAAAAFSSVQGAFFVYGGGTNANPLNITTSDDVWSFDGASWSQVTTSGDAPSARLFVAYAYDSSRDRLIVFGGQVGDFVSPGLNDLYALDLATGTWSLLHDGSGTAPSGRFSAMMSYDAEADRYVVFGGHADPGVTNDVWAFSPADGGWTELAGGDSFTGAPLGCLGNSREIPNGYVTQDLSAPERRSGGVLAIQGAVMRLFGGESDCSDHLDDTWQLDLADPAWTELIEARSGESCARRNDDCQCLCL